jgi:formylglycine-generating enzyme
MNNLASRFAAISLDPLLATFLIIMIVSVSRGQTVAVALSNVGNQANSPDPNTGRGAVDHEYAIGTFDITEAQYTAFLNAVAQHDRYRLYSLKMATAGYTGPTIAPDDPFFHWDTGIARSGGSGEGYTYSVIGASGSIPVVEITWLDAARFCNWLHNGQPKGLGEVAGSTEDGAYTLDGDKTNGTETRNPGAKWWLPTSDEWYKAAFYDPRLNGGAGGYWKFPTQSNAVPGNVIGSGSNEANGIANRTFSAQSNPGHPVCPLTPVGAFRNSHSYYGVYDMAGDVCQWLDSLVTQKTGAKYRAIEGGSPNVFTFEFASSSGFVSYPATTDSWDLGFRVASYPQPDPGKR